ncbi:MAG: hypothetical protein QMD22_00635 [archaeon]|nr:hypothetical protein [archaeon]
MLRKYFLKKEAVTGLAESFTSEISFGEKVDVGDGFIILQNKILVEMTEVEFKGIKKIVILEEVKYSSEEEFYKAVIQEVSPDFPVIVLWAEGVIFKHTPMLPDLEEFAKRYADEGVVYWANVLYAKKEEYEEEKEIEMHTIKIIKAPAPALVDAAKALRKRLEEIR